MLNRMIQKNLEQASQWFACLAVSDLIVFEQVTSGSYKNKTAVLSLSSSHIDESIDGRHPSLLI